MTNTLPRISRQALISRIGIKLSIEGMVTTRINSTTEHHIGQLYFKSHTIAKKAKAWLSENLGDRFSYKVSMCCGGRILEINKPS